MSSIFGKKVKISIFGQSHSKAIGMTLDDFPHGFKFDLDEVNYFLSRRKAKSYEYVTKRIEEDEFEILSGIVNEYSSGAPICGIIYNNNINKKDYKNLQTVPRPGHSDLPAMIKYEGFSDLSGGGHFSGRLTAPLCLGGALVLQYLQSKGIEIETSIDEIGGVTKQELLKDNKVSFEVKDNKFSSNQLLKMEETKEELELFSDILKEAIVTKDSVGGIVSCRIKGLPIGLGNPMFESIESEISQIIFSIPGVKGIEFGAGFEGTRLKGSEYNDSYYYDESNTVRIDGNNHGGVLGGISTSNDITFKVAIKPVSSIGIPQKSIDTCTKKNVDLEIGGRHDPCIIPRILPVIEAVSALAIINLHGFEKL